MIAIIGGLVAVIGAIASQAARDRAREMDQVRRAASTLGIELAAIAESIRLADWKRPTTYGLYEMRPVPRNAYDGIVNSGVLGRFDLRSQEMLYRFYWRSSIGDYETMNAMIEQVATATIASAPKGLRLAKG